ncbi:hypothetical protein CAP35_03305 [Chitinophagaceae bacterium IBVUCB1]|nr:hypothetical protein CAP35_03305 [Chitinophagaceae bacterium IBVUCB1]
MRKIVFLLLSIFVAAQVSNAQGLHFSQFYNAPLLLNPANSALMSTDDYRVGMNYRSQWTKLAVPYNTFSAFGDCMVYKNGMGTNWMGLGVVFYNDVAGDGNLRLTRGDLSLAYHVQTSETFLISAGLSAAYATRSVDYNKLTFDMQWDRFKFDKNLPNGEQINIVQTSFYDVGGGINFSFFPNELVFIKLGGSVAHINQPVETFYNLTNKMAIRPMVSLDGSFVVDKNFTLNPAVYYTTQRGATEIVAGTLLTAVVFGQGKVNSSIIGGAHYRVNDAFIGSLGVQIGGLRILSSYDYTTSSLASDMSSNGAFEFSIVYQGQYGEKMRGAKNMNCPRFY